MWLRGAGAGPCTLQDPVKDSPEHNPLREVTLDELEASGEDDSARKKAWEMEM